MSKPTVLIPCDVRQIGIHPFHCVGEKYINAVAHGAGAIPLLIPSWGNGQDLQSLEDSIALDDILASVDGVFLPGSPSNVHPSRFGGNEDREQMLDEQRDSLTFRLIDACIRQEMPVFAVCRGLQELNVALGGILHQAVHEVNGFHDHREDPLQDRDAQYSPAHTVSVQPGGLLASILGAGDYEVNSLHGQGIDRLADSLTAEALADDGLVEAVSMRGREVLGVQWHPEWKFSNKADYRLLFEWFGERLRHRFQQRMGENR